MFLVQQSTPCILRAFEICHIIRIDYNAFDPLRNCSIKSFPTGELTVNWTFDIIIMNRSTMPLIEKANYIFTWYMIITQYILIVTISMISARINLTHEN